MVDHESTDIAGATRLAEGRDGVPGIKTMVVEQVDRADCPTCKGTGKTTFTTYRRVRGRTRPQLRTSVVDCDCLPAPAEPSLLPKAGAGQADEITAYADLYEGRRHPRAA